VHRGVIMRSHIVVAAALVGSFLIACGADDGGSLYPGGRRSSSSTPGSTGFGESEVVETENGACAATVAQTEKAKVDIIFVIDNSGSMGEEMTQIRTNVNRFAEKVGSIGLDYRVLFIVKKASPSYPSNLTLCVPAPLAGAGCADNAPKFFHIDQDVQSSNSLDIILRTYDGSTSTSGDKFGNLDNGGTPVAPWKDKLRVESTKVFVEVTDDESSMSAEAFDAALLAKLPAGMFGTAQNRKYVFHSIISKPAGDATPSSKICGTAAGTSLQYQKLSQLTGGLMDEVCKADYSSVLDNIAKGIVDRLGCELGYPGQGTDPTKVVVRYTPSGAPAANLTQVTDASKCAQVKDGWYYDDPSKPSKIVLCPSMCGTANTSPGTKIEALVGCQAPAPR
jgi:hypothetical protein